MISVRRLVWSGSFAGWMLMGGVLSGCAELKTTGRALRDDSGLLMDSEERYLGNRQFRIVLRGSSVLFDGQAEQAFRHRADEYTRSLGCRGWKLVEYKAGIENTLFGGRRYVDAVVECLNG